MTFGVHVQGNGRQLGVAQFRCFPLLRGNANTSTCCIWKHCPENRGEGEKHVG